MIEIHWSVRPETHIYVYVGTVLHAYHKATIDGLSGLRACEYLVSILCMPHSGWLAGRRQPDANHRFLNKILTPIALYILSLAMYRLYCKAAVSDYMKGDRFHEKKFAPRKKIIVRISNIVCYVMMNNVTLIPKTRHDWKFWVQLSMELKLVVQDLFTAIFDLRNVDNGLDKGIS